MTDAPASNVPEYTVSEISGAVKRTLEGAFGRVRVRGEITELKRYSSGHIYFCLKDEGAKIKAVVWKFAVPRLGLAPEDGVEVIATGKLSSYGERSEYQLIIDRLEYAGAGALLARVEMLRQKLAAEGLFDAARKRPWPLLPDVVGVVTSPQGAVIQDIRTTILRRFPRRILLWPVPVQGEGAAARIAAAIAGFSALPPHGAIPRPDVLIVARGGGSLEDLMAFNDEAVVRAAAACTIPLISAVGHETDTTLLDHAADRRAATPTAAAELAVPSRAELLADVQQKAARLSGAANRLLQDRRLRLQRAERGLPDPAALLGATRQRLDDRAARLALALPNLVRQRRAALVDVERHLAAPTALIAAKRAALDLLETRRRAALRHAVAARSLPRLSPAPLLAQLREARARLEGLAARLESVSHRAVLARGYAAVFDAAGQPLTTAAAVKPGAGLRIEFADGAVRATAARDDRRQGALPL
ncbi:MAG: exodeoxyribonuclease VII large subunit [Rhodospirillales bacterium]|nr:exodeoxyribonuclease VII large subunit [Rhodospirillales bacterium]